MYLINGATKLLKGTSVLVFVSSANGTTEQQDVLWAPGSHIKVGGNGGYEDKMPPPGRHCKHSLHSTIWPQLTQLHSTSG